LHSRTAAIYACYSGPAGGVLPCDTHRRETTTLTEGRILKKMLGQVLMEAGLVSIDDINAALDTQKSTGQKLGEVLIGMGILTAEQLKSALEFEKGDA
jgi:hypothetical protein